MENDQIKSQIENAKRAFVASKERDREASSDRLDIDDAQLQKNIMERLRSLMDEAAQSTTGTAAGPIISSHSPPESRVRPFWAQNRIDIPPSEKFGKRQKMQEQDSPNNTKPLGITEHPSPTEPQPGSDPLVAIRQEVFNKLGDSVGQSEEIQGLSERLQQLESQTEKQQQDLTALLKLLRQLANKQAELEKQQSQPRRQRSLFVPLILLLLVMLAASAGWLYWLNPDLVMTLSTTLLNNGFNFMLDLIAQFGLL